MPHAVAVDIGGTFTDLVAYDYDSHAVVYTKSPTTYGNLVEGVLDCFAKAKLDPRAANFVNHGTTLVINSLIQRMHAAFRAGLGQRRLVGRQPDHQELMRVHDRSSCLVGDDRPDPGETGIQRLVVDLHAPGTDRRLAAFRAGSEERRGPGIGGRQLGCFRATGPVLELEVDGLAIAAAGDERIARHETHMLAHPCHIRDVGALRAIG